MLIGAALQSPHLADDAMYAFVAAREFNALTTEYELKFRWVQPQPGVFDFRGGDALVQFAETHDMAVRGHTLVWHQEMANWFDPVRTTREEAISILRNHIYTVVSHYRGRIAIWDVVNEAFLDNGELRPSPWLQTIGPEYLEMAFVWAHMADPDALLYYNDFGINTINRKTDAVHMFLRRMIDKGVPVHGIGLQMHLELADIPRFNSIQSTMSRFSEVGLDVQITELDVVISGGSGTEEEKLAVQAETHAQSMQACLNVSRCTGFTMWGFTDRHSYLNSVIGEDSLPLPFDTMYQPKPAYTALFQVLSG